MKKILNIIILSLILIVVILVPTKANAQEAEITRVVCSNVYDGELRDGFKATFEGLNINLDDAYFLKQDDYVRCTMKVKNNSNETIMIDTSSISSKSDGHISYDLSAVGKNNIQPGEIKTYELNIIYESPYGVETVIDNSLQTNLVVSNVSGNPSTGYNHSIIIIIISLALITVLIISIKNKKAKYFIIAIITGMILLPTVNAIANISISINGKIHVETSKKYFVYYVYNTVLNEEEANNYLNITKEEYLGLNKDFSYLYNNVNYYYYYITDDDGKYAPGETVELIEKEIKDIGDGCALSDDPETIICESLDTKNLSWWGYKGEDYDQLSFTGEGTTYDGKCLNMETQDFTENCKMNNMPKSFTMPEHDVYLYAGTSELQH